MMAMVLTLRCILDSYGYQKWYLCDEGHLLIMMEKKLVGGKNGFGIKLVFVFAKWGEIETVIIFESWNIRSSRSKPI